LQFGAATPESLSRVKPESWRTYVMLQTEMPQRIPIGGGYNRLSLFTESEIRDLQINVPDNRTFPVSEMFICKLYAARLIKHYGYPENRLALEYPISFDDSKLRADIVIFDKEEPDRPYIIVEVKKGNLTGGEKQLRFFCNATGAPIGVLTNGQQAFYYHRRDSDHFEYLIDIPSADQTLADIHSGHLPRFTLRDLGLKDKLTAGRKSLKDIILDMEDAGLTTAGVNILEEVFKLIFTKLYDEVKSRDDEAFVGSILHRQMKSTVREPGRAYVLCGSVDEVSEKTSAGIQGDGSRALEFRTIGHTDSELRAKVQGLFDEAKSRWPGIFPRISAFKLSDSHLAICVSCLQDIKLFNAHLDGVYEAFEYLVNREVQGRTGQYFTPRHVIDMCVKMLNPYPGESMIDTAAGSGRFLVHTLFSMKGKTASDVKVSVTDKEPACKVFGIDFSEKMVRIARILNLIAGYGEITVLPLNTLDYEHWNDVAARGRIWKAVYGPGFEALKTVGAGDRENRRFNFDILVANPPFGSSIQERRILRQYTLGTKANGELQTKVGRDILFLERNLDFLKPGGRMAVILPQAIFNSTSAEPIRDFIAARARILAVIGLDTNTFTPYIGTKMSVLCLQKWNNNPTEGPLCPKVDNYPIFFAASEKGGKDNAGDSVYLKSQYGSYTPDKHGHLIVEQDLHNHEGELPDGIAEAFIAWARRENLSFWSENVRR